MIGSVVKAAREGNTGFLSIIKFLTYQKTVGRKAKKDRAITFLEGFLLK
jgi:hypothetical protein